MGNLAFTNTLNQLTISNIHKMSTCRLFEKFTATSRQCLGQPQNKEASPKEHFERVIKDQQVILRFAIGRRTAHLDPFLAALGDILVRAACHSRWDLDDLQGLQGVTTETADGKRSKAGIYPLNGYLLLSFKREVFRFVWVEA